MIPIEPETFEHAAERFPAAVKREWDGDAVVADVLAGGHGDRPGKTRAHVFDLEGDGGDIWRLIVSTERHSKIGRVLHVSSSRERALGGQMTRDGAITRTMMMLALISGGDSFKPVSTSFSDKGVLHLVFNSPETAKVA